MYVEVVVVKRQSGPAQALSVLSLVTSSPLKTYGAGRPPSAIKNTLSSHMRRGIPD